MGLEVFVVYCAFIPLIISCLIVDIQCSEEKELKKHLPAIILAIIFCIMLIVGAICFMISI